MATSHIATMFCIIIAKGCNWEFQMSTAGYIRKPHQQIALTHEQLMEMARLIKRPTGVRRFVNYVKINTEKGDINFAKVIKEFQWDMIDLFQHNERSILLASRQMSKCVAGESKITVRNDKTGEQMELTIEEFHLLQKNG